MADAIDFDLNNNVKKMQMRPIKIIRWELFLASFIILFQELILIRWLPAQVRVLSYFPNIILLSAFLGLGIGCLRSNKPSLIWLWPISLLVITISAILGSKIAFTQESISEYLWLLYYDLPENAFVYKDVKLPIIVGFVLSGISFIPLGQFVACRIQEFNHHSLPLWGYIWDILGSLTGVITFSIVGYLEIFPLYWFTLIFIVGLFFFYKERNLIVVYMLIAAIICTLVFINEKALHYSPYYAISFERYENILHVTTNGSFHQSGVNLKYDTKLENKSLIHVREGYHLPYRFMEGTPKKALVLGAGTGNDVAVMLDEGVEQIDIVEIDPFIIELGYELHPNSPYKAENVNVFNTDARTFLNNTKENYDLIVFGTLDSMTRLSALSNVRLDNYVYTLNCIRKARSLLKQNGGIVMYFMSQTSYIDQKLRAILAEAFGQTPMIIEEYFGLFNRIYLAGPAFDTQINKERMLVSADDNYSFMDARNIPTDDWPYLYLSDRKISTFYLTLIGIIILITILSISLSSGHMRKSIFAGVNIDIQMFLFGFAFLLIETSYITKMSLVWGATWITSAVVFTSILLMILLSTINAQLRPLPMKISAVFLILALICAYFFPFEILLSQIFIIKLISSIIIVGTPIFFAGMCFALLFKQRKRADLAFGWNLIGAVMGGLAEYLTMITGFKALLLIAIATYLLSYIFRSSEVNGDTVFKT
jgi:spermidine synthase